MLHPFVPTRQIRLHKKVNTHTQHTNDLGLGELFYTQPLCSKAVAKIKCMFTIHHRTYRISEQIAPKSHFAFFMFAFNGL